MSWADYVHVSNIGGSVSIQLPTTGLIVVKKRIHQKTHLVLCISSLASLQRQRALPPNMQHITSDVVDICSVPSISLKMVELTQRDRDFLFIIKRWMNALSIWILSLWHMIAFNSRFFSVELLHTLDSSQCKATHYITLRASDDLLDHPLLYDQIEIQFTPAIFSNTGQTHDAFKHLIKGQIHHKLTRFEGEAKQSKVGSLMKWWLKLLWLSPRRLVVISPSKPPSWHAPHWSRKAICYR